MIPQQLRLQMVCDQCGATHQFILKTEDIDSQGFDLVLETALRDESWAVRYPYTICASCVDKILEEALQRMEETLEAKHHPESAEVSS